MAKNLIQNVFVLKISAMNEKGEYDYVNVAGVFAKFEGALEVALGKIERQKEMWANCSVKQIETGRFRVKAETGIVKFYEISEMMIR